MENKEVILKQKFLIKGYEKYPQKEDIIPDDKIPEGYTKYGEKLFDTPQEVWFWFMKYEQFKEYFIAYKPISVWTVPRPCIPSDIYIIVKRFYLEKIISYNELKTMLKYGKIGREPNCYDKKELNDWESWESAMDKLYSVLYKKGIINRKKHSYEN